MPDSLNSRDATLVRWLNEAYAKEAELEADLTAHIALTRKDSYRKRLRAHLDETRAHKRRVEQRIEALGGTAASGPARLPGVPAAVGELAGKAVAAVKGQVGGARAIVTDQVQTHLRNAQEELREEHVEIALYRRIEAFAAAVDDRETERLAGQIIRDEQRMAKFLDAEIGRLVKEYVRKTVPAGERAGASGGSRPTRSRRSPGSARRGSSGRSTTSRSRSGSRTAAGSARRS